MIRADNLWITNYHQTTSLQVECKIYVYSLPYHQGEKEGLRKRQQISIYIGSNWESIMIDNDFHIDDRAHLRSTDVLETSGATTANTVMSHSWPMTKNDVMIKEVMESRKTKSQYHKFKGMCICWNVAGFFSKLNLDLWSSSIIVE